MKNKKYLILSIMFVFMMSAIISGSTYGFLQWSITSTSGTGVVVTVGNDAITMHIEPENTVYKGLKPTSNCRANASYSDTLVTIVNNTGTLAIPSFKLKVKVTKGGSGELTSEILSHINYSVVPLETTKDRFGNPVKGTTGGYSCSNVPYGNDADDGGYVLFSNAYGWDTHLNFRSVSTNGTWSHIPSEGDETGNYPLITGTTVYLPRQYFLNNSPITGFSKGDVNGITFRGEAYSTSYQYFRVYVWIDEGYTSMTLGDEIIDPLQKAVIEVTWSEESMVQQVSGESIVDTSPVIAAGLYDGDGNMTYTWDELISNGDIQIQDIMNNPNDPYITITGSNSSLTGELIISNEIMGIGPDAFYDTELTSVYIPASVGSIAINSFRGSSIEEIQFAPGIRLSSIESYAFYESALKSIEIPASVTVIESCAFQDSDLASITFAPDSKLQIIDVGAFNGTDITNIEIPEGVTHINQEAFANTTLTSIEIPSSVTYLGVGAFNSSSLTSITYAGTKTQWNAIEKATNWYGGLSANKVICSDGEVYI